MRSADEWFEAYGESHKNPTNKLIHWICVPVIFVSLIAMLWDVRIPIKLEGELFGLAVAEWTNLGIGLLTFALCYYAVISKSLAIGMLLVAALSIWGAVCIGHISGEYGLTRFQGGLSLFVVAWIGQFIGHKIEGKKPSFLEDIQFLMIGPLWLLGFIYRRLNISY